MEKVEKRQFTTEMINFKLSERGINNKRYMHLRYKFTRGVNTKEV